MRILNVCRQNYLFNLTSSIPGYLDRLERRHQKRPKVVHVDEAGLHDGIHIRRSYAPLNTTPSINTTDSKQKDTIVASVASDGTKFPLYVCVSFYCFY